MVMGSSMLLLFYPGLGWTLARLPVLLLPQSSVAEAWIGVRISLYIDSYRHGYSRLIVPRANARTYYLQYAKFSIVLWP